MSSLAQERIAKRLTIFMALAVTASLLLVGWTLYRPGATPPAPAPLSMGR